jgi:hypothetical protein
MGVYRSFYSYRLLGVRQSHELITFDSAMDQNQQGNGSSASVLDPESLRSSAGWIRDELDPIVAREGPSSLEPDDVLTVHNLLVSIKSAPPMLQVISFSRIHLAIQAICGKATRWPTKLADEADRAMDAIEIRHGPVRGIRFPLFEPGGRLWNVCEPQDTSDLKDADDVGFVSAVREHISRFGGQFKGIQARKSGVYRWAVCGPRIIGYRTNVSQLVVKHNVCSPRRNN